MTLRELIEKRVYFYKRIGWEAGQYVHLDRLYRVGEGQAGGARVCFCAAPVDANDPSVDDDLWLQYEGPESLVEMNVTSVPANMRNVSPLMLLGLMALMGEPPTPVKEPLPDIPDFHINRGEMRA